LEVLPVKNAVIDSSKWGI